MATARGIYSLTAAADPQAVCTLFEAEAAITSCVVVGTIGEAAVTPLFPGATAAINETTATVVTIDVGTSTGGTWAISSDGEDSGDIDFDAADSVVETAVEAITGVTAVGVTGDGQVGTPWVITYVTPVDAVVTVLDGASLTGGDSTLTVTITTQGVDGISAVDTAITYDTLVGSFENGIPVKATLDSEIVLVTAATDTVLTVVRAVDGTVGAIHADDGVITFHGDILAFPEKVLFNVVGETVVAITNAATAVGGVEVAAGYPAVA